MSRARSRSRWPIACGVLAGLCSMLLLIIAETLSMAAGGADVVVPASHGDYCQPGGDHADRPVVVEIVLGHTDGAAATSPAPARATVTAPAGPHR